MATFTRPWRRKRPSTTSHPSLSRQRSTPASTAKDEKLISKDREKPLPVPLLPSPNVLTTFPTEPPPKVIPLISPVPDKVVDACGGVKDDTEAINTSRELNTTGAYSGLGLLNSTLIWPLESVVAMVQGDGKQLGPIVKAAVSPVQQSDMGKAIKERIDRFSEGMPVFMNALDELKALHPFIEGELIQ